MKSRRCTTRKVIVFLCIRKGETASWKGRGNLTLTFRNQGGSRRRGVTAQGIIRGRRINVLLPLRGRGTRHRYFKEVTFRHDGARQNHVERESRADILRQTMDMERFNPLSKNTGSGRTTIEEIRGKRGYVLYDYRQRIKKTVSKSNRDDNKPSVGQP